MNRIRSFVFHCGKGKKNGYVFAAVALRKEERKQAEKGNKRRKGIKRKKRNREGKGTNERRKTEGEENRRGGNGGIAKRFALYEKRKKNLKIGTRDLSFPMPNRNKE